MIIPIPPFLSHLQVDPRGYAIPYFVPIHDGKPDFRYMDTKKSIKAITGKLCHICGKKLHKDYSYVITGPHGLKNQVCTDAAMHRDCAEYSLQVCPHMYYEKSVRKTEDDAYNVHLAFNKPPVLFLIKIAGYKYQAHPPHGQLFLHWKPVQAIEYIYVNNILTKKNV